MLTRMYRIKTIALIKLDCEGCEWRLGLDWLRQGLIHDIRALIGEVHPTSFQCMARLYALRAGYSKHDQRSFQSVDHRVSCAPQGLTIDETIDVWEMFCNTPRFQMHCPDDFVATLRVGGP